MGLHIVKDCCGKHRFMAEKKLYKQITEQGDLGPYWSIKLDDIYEIINRPAFSVEYRYKICYSILNCYLNYLVDHTISLEETLRVLKFWWDYREYINNSNDTSTNGYVVIQLMAKIITKNIVPSKTLSKDVMDNFSTFYCQMKAHQWREIPNFDELCAWVSNLKPSYESLLADVELNSYSKNKTE